LGRGGKEGRKRGRGEIGSQWRLRMRSLLHLNYSHKRRRGGGEKRKRKKKKEGKSLSRACLHFLFITDQGGEGKRGN